jgi:hypothetical protein
LTVFCGMSHVRTELRAHGSDAEIVTAELRIRRKRARVPCPIRHSLQTFSKSARQTPWPVP